ncbi:MULTISPECIES: sensor histidine kinase [Amycolatopsis]|uniref:histidine kinase n=1 Tax=Amycolatopsis japonica TaxID=208439 RepID=A0A075V1M8_9PSEU|nr:MULTISPECIES: histidine kinase [Amycolatopsis]AIG78504.1 Conserved putative membrane protein [Amycolatopsis japonica]
MPIEVALPFPVPTRVADGVLAVCCALTTTPFAVSGLIYGYFRWQPPLWFWLPAAILVGGAAWFRRRHQWWFAVIALTGWVALSGIFAVVLAQYTVAERTRSWRLTAVGTFVTLVVVGVPIWRLGGFDASLPQCVAVCVAPALLGLYVGTRRELIAEMRERVEQAEQDRDLRVQQARSDERAQIARDMHDVVTHRVSLIVLHATALEATRGRDVTTVAARIGTIGRAALDELRSLVSVLRADSAVPLTPQPGLADLADLVDQTRALGVPVVLDVNSGVPAPALVQQAVYRVVQEALTNVRKYAGDAVTQVRVRRETDLIRLVVLNEAGTEIERQGGLPGGGHGLLGIAERIRLLGGELTAGPTAGGGFLVEAVVPVTGESER